MLRRVLSPGLLRAPRASSLMFPALRTATVVPRRFVATDRITDTDEQSILTEQRKNRPMSPHLEIYKPQLTWYLSGLHRITGIALALPLYGVLCAYALGPYVGLPFTIAGVAAKWAAAPAALKVLTKTAIAFPFMFHSWNGLRHLIWDTGRELTLKGVYKTGYIVLGLTVVTSFGLALL